MLYDDLYDVGIAQRRQMFGPEGAEGQTEATTDLDDKLQEIVTRICFGDIWQREGLAVVDRSKVTVGMLVALGKAHEIRVHLRGALANGVSPVELREIVLHAFLYAGIPAAVEGMRALTEVLAERGDDLDLEGGLAAAAREARA